MAGELRAAELVELVEQTREVVVVLHTVVVVWVVRVDQV